ncbi:exported protein of unknown function [Petrocella atlantisensis]|uniref:Copper amine oxidase-like N-terminal domain-containing protein n=1 Tax=Petrocella atlantisensis TaxID=2173034 RepID=A0A3P7PAT1_9FIRM|nr:copper amine oxidase N-terminal domain-containing protein [Petrocella atlantisensis]VDN47283.1 exported protein of unknown function [Petrocella atlantisensis]
MKKMMIVLLMALVLISNYGFANAQEAPEKVILQEADLVDDENVDDENVDDEDVDDEDVDDEDVDDENVDDEDVDDEDNDDEDETENEYEDRMNNFRYERKLNEEEEGLRELLEELMDDEDVNEDDLISLESQIEELEKQAAELRAQLRQLIQGKYSQAELDELEIIKDEIEEDDDVKALDVDSIITNGNLFKFDTPPVIKDGRTLVPVRAISEGFQADVIWIQEEQKVIITKGDKTIELVLDEEKATVNGQVVELDTEAIIMNSRTMVPLRFVGEALGVTIQWNALDRTIEIIDETIVVPASTEVNEPVPTL